MRLRRRGLSALAAGGAGALAIKAVASGNRVVERFGPMNRGPLADDVAGTFRSGTYDGVVSSAPTAIWRVRLS